MHDRRRFFDFDETVTHRDWNASRIRIVPNDQAEKAKAELRILFPHEPLHVAPMGCSHLCLYTGGAPASAVEERILDHMELVEHKHLR
jgi:hypothetical protein